MITLENTEGYTQGECDTLNAEFEKRYESGEWDFLSEPGRRDEAEKAFNDEVSRRMEIDDNGDWDTIYMNEKTGEIAAYDGWYYTDDDGKSVNAVDLGQVVEVEWNHDNCEWEEV